MDQQDTFPSKIFDIIQKIANLSFDSKYLFRGEPKSHCKISSTLYRECKGIFQKAGLEDELSDFDIEGIEKEISNQVKAFTPASEHTSNLSILTELQHYESQTNLIDFTTDFHIALFFACDGQPDKDGRVIILQESSVNTEQPIGVEHRVSAQKSVFVRPEQGYIDPDKAKYKVVKIPACLKEDILRYLRNGHGITTETIYNDLHGYIRNKKIHQSAYGEFHIAFAYQNKAKKAEDPEEENKFRDKAIDHYTKAIRYNPNFHSAYENRKTLHSEKKENYEAVQDSKKVSEDPSNLIRESDGRWMEIQDPRNIFGDLPTQKMAQKALRILVSHAQKREIITLRQLAQEIAPHSTQFNWSMGWALAWIHTTLYELEQSDEWNYGEIPAIAAIAVAKPERPTNWMDENTRINPNTPLPWEDYETDHILPVFEYPHWDKVMDFVFGS